MKVYELKKNMIKEEIYKRKKVRLSLLANELKKVKKSEISLKNVDIVLSDFIGFKKSKKFSYIRDNSDNLTLEELRNLDNSLYVQEVIRVNNLLFLIKKELVKLEKGRL